jgi:hypothetical protein
MKTFETHFKNLTKGMEDHEFKHYNHAMGCYIYSKEHYLSEMKRRGLVPLEMVEELKERHEKLNPKKEYELSDEARDLINYFKNVSRKGFITLGEHPKAVRKMEELGLDFFRDINKFINQN